MSGRTKQTARDALAPERLVVREFRFEDNAEVQRIFREGMLEMIPDTAWRALRSHPESLLLYLFMLSECPCPWTIKTDSCIKYLCCELQGNGHPFDENDILVISLLRIFWIFNCLYIMLYPEPDPVRSRNTEYFKHQPITVSHALTHSLTYSQTRSRFHSLTDSLIHSLTDSLIRSVTHRLTHPFTHLPTHSLAHTLKVSLSHSLRLPHSQTHSFTHRLTNSLARSLTHWPSRSLTHWLAHSLTHWLAHSLNHRLTRLFTHSLTHSLFHSLKHKQSNGFWKDRANLFTTWEKSL